MTRGHLAPETLRTLRFEGLGVGPRGLVGFCDCHYIKGTVRMQVLIMVLAGHLACW